ncbi:hypothetical protein V8C86DRAFT_2574440 [Haematococcus lacustris]
MQVLRIGCRSASPLSTQSGNQLPNVPRPRVDRWSTCKRGRSFSSDGPFAAAASRSIACGGAATHAAAQPSARRDSVYPLDKTQTLVETAMLAAVSGLAYLVSTLLKLDGSLGYFLPLPVVLAALRGGIAAGWRTMTATGFLLVVLLGPFRSLSYVLIHGLLAASLATMWKAKANFWVVVVVGAAVRMAGQMAYLVLSSVTLNENLFAVMMSNVYAMLDQICAAVGAHGSPSTMAIMCVVFALLSVNALCYVFLLQVIYRFILQSMGYSLGPLPAIVRKYLFAGAVEPSTAEAKLA